MKESDYSKIEKAIIYLEQNYKKQPNLDEVADYIGLSPAHFQKLFKKWAGISPKKFVQFLTVEYVKSQLDKSVKVIDATFDSGLSSTSRIHDLFINIEAMSPTEFKLHGKNLNIYYGFFESPFGPCLIAATDKGLCALHFTSSDEEGLEIIKKDWKNANIISSNDKTIIYFNKIFKNLNPNQPINVILKGTDFQIQVWKALLNTHKGELVTYEDIAKSIKTKAIRAVGSAIGHNNISFLIPCHRVINKIGIIGNYRWGTQRKKAIIAWEAAKK